MGREKPVAGRERIAHCMAERLRRRVAYDAQAHVVLAQWRHDYNTVRPHSELGGLTPAEMAGRIPSTTDPKTQRFYF